VKDAVNYDEQSMNYSTETAGNTHMKIVQPKDNVFKVSNNMNITKKMPY
jgi:hypothetical protein